MMTFRILATAISVLLVSGCQGQVGTRIEVLDDSTSKVHVVLELEGEARDAVLGEPELDQRLLAYMAEATAVPASRSDEDRKLTYSAEPASSQLLGKLTGVGAVESSERAGKTTTTVALVDPADLRAAVVNATAGEVDAMAMSIAWQESIFLRLELQMPGSVRSVTGIDPKYVRAVGNEVEIRAPLRSWPSGRLIVVAERSTNRLYFLVPTIALLLVVLTFGRRKRHRGSHD